MTFPIVGIGASAGGLEAVSDLLAHLPPDPGLAVIVVQHLDRDHPSLLTELLAKRTRLAVVQTKDGVMVEPDHVYVIPPGALLILEDGRLRVRPRAAGPDRFRPVDSLFHSLAKTRAENAIAVVLSGGDADGALGLRSIKLAGGITFAQEPASARFPSMPYNAIETDCVDFVLPPAGIARELTRLARHPYLRAPAPTELVAEERPAEEASAREQDSLRRIFRRLRSTHGVDFTHYKLSTIRRRIARRMALQKIDDLADYAAVFEDDAAEAAALYQDFLIRVTGFFRDSETFDALAKRVLPVVCEGRSPRETLRFWVPGCATGEEAYSIAIALVEHLGDRAWAAGFQVFGTDVSEEAIEKARAGLYFETIASEVSPERLERFFVKQDERYRIAKSVRDACIFARHDVTRDPPFSRLDLISCRNVLIYLDAVTQRRMMHAFHFALRSHGFLVLGPSEGVGQSGELFEIVDKSQRIYTRKAATGTGASLASADRPRAHHRAPPDSESASLADTESAPREADRLLLTRFAPPSLLVDDALNILQFRGDTVPYLAHASGPSSLHLSRLIRPELLAHLMPAIGEARERGGETRRDGLRVGDRPEVSIVVSPLRTSAERGFLIWFDEGSRPPRDGRAPAAVANALPESEKDRRLAQAEREVMAIRAYLQATMEAHEAVREQLKSAQEEVLSANEEFQSTNEELETAKEELQSTNEELSTTNDQLRDRNRELTALNDAVESERRSSERARAYADQLIDTVREPLVVLDAELRVIRVNQAFYAAFGVRPDETGGRRFFELGNRQWDTAELREQLDAVTAHGEVTESEVAHDFPMLGRRVMSVNARKLQGDADRGDLILVAIDDVTERRAVLARLRDEAQHKDEFLAMLAHELRNPLAPILNAITLLQSTVTSDAETKLQGMIERQTHVLMRLVDELLDAARLASGRIELQQEPVDLVAIAQQAADVIQPRVDAQRHTLSRVLPGAPVEVDGDPVRLEQVVVNLLENAVKYTPSAGQIIMTVTGGPTEAVLSVRDTGIGLAPNMCDRIFDVFAQADRSLARTRGGLGLGLTLVRRLLELHGGRIEARSEGLGHGSEFVARLPLAAPGRVAPAETPAAIEPDAPWAQQRVLIVDDSADAAKSLEMLVRSWGHEVAIARDGPEALARAATFQPGVVLVDIGLPGMDGHELARRWRRDPARTSTKLIAVSGYGRPEDHAASRVAGFDAHLNKPADVEELKRMLAEGRSGSGDPG